ncbi:hypothetical protein [Pseudomonas panipatensis]|uniref:Glycine-rich domain-containing protein n=1 Tax=Pseudomonas panipatensis TaxID=428992 RepID=A0A1G8LDX7_9PSED|nr:hypothetical protein [Pseudomonas panipatensis]SDI53894.1 hypothetical protein SAMN05216272_11198 [Pseudomonas panipatensis]SMP75085.1 hypothetical protein SAMN06295951_113102 [Pseudomonas panipatensis]
MANNDFLPFAGGAGSNVLTQSAYAALAARTAGFSAGTAQSAQLNKVWRQSSIMAAVLAQLIVDKTGLDAVDDGTTATLLANLKSALSIGVTAAQFDASTKLATTAFVQNALGNIKAFQAVTANTALTAAQAGTYVCSNAGTGAVNLQLPLLSSVAPGATFVISHISSAMSSFAVGAAGSDLLVFLDFATQLTPYVMAKGETIVVVSTGSAWKIMARTDGIANGRLIGVQVFASAGSFTYTPTDGTKSVVVEAVGGGGGGGGAPASGAGAISVGGGGGAGAYAKKRITSGFAGVTVTVGAGGTASAGATGGAGGSSSFGALLSVGGGAGGATGGPAGSCFFANGGSGSLTISGSPDVSSSGGIGFAGYGIVGTGYLPVGGFGGASYFGMGGNGGSGSVGGAAQAKGSGGGGAGIGVSASALAGGVGASGMVIVWEYA